MRALDVQREIDRITQNRQLPVAWTRADVNSPIIHEEMMQRHPELRQYYPVPLYYGPQE